MARKEEIDYLINHNNYKLAKITECWDKTGEGTTTVKFVDTNKGTDEEQEIRSRLVAREFKPRGEKNREGKGRVIGVFDVIVELSIVGLLRIGDFNHVYRNQGTHRMCQSMHDQSRDGDAGLLRRRFRSFAIH